MKPIVIASLISIGILLTAGLAHSADEAHQKRFVMEFVQNDGRVSGLELIIAGAADEARSPIELLEKQVGLKWSGFPGGVVYRFNRRSEGWEPIMTRDMRSAETRIGETSGLKISELKSGDILVLYPPSP